MKTSGTDELLANMLANARTSMDSSRDPEINKIAAMNLEYGKIELSVRSTVALEKIADYLQALSLK